MMVWQDYFAEPLRSLDDLEWLLSPDDSLEFMKFLNKITDGSTNRLAEASNLRTPLLALLHRSNHPHQITKISLVLPVKSSHLLKSLPLDRITPHFSIETQEPGPHDLASFTVFHATPKLADQPSCVNALISQIFSVFLTTGRLLRHYNCSFLLPLDLVLDEELEAKTPNSAVFQPHPNAEIERYRITPLTRLLHKIQHKKSISDDDEANAQAHEFFYTHLREQLFETHGDEDGAAEKKPNTAAVKPIIQWRLRPECLIGQRLDLIDRLAGGTSPAVKVTSAALEEVTLFQYYNNLFLLAIRVGLPENGMLLRDYQGARNEGQEAYAQLVSDGDDWWRALVYSSADQWNALQLLQVERWLRFTKTARLLFCSFLEQKLEGKDARLRLRQYDQTVSEQHARDPFSPIVLHFIKKFLPSLSECDLTRDRRLRQVADDRMFVHVAYALSGPAPSGEEVKMTEFERLFGYALYVDQHSDGSYSPDQWAYDQCYTRSLMEQHALYRWFSINSLSGYTSASSVFMGFGDFFQTPIAAVHVPYIYIKIQILALLFRATLDRFDRRIAAATQVLTLDGYSSAFRRMRRDFISFTNNYWFRQLSPQVQGEEIATRMMQRQDLQIKYELVKDKMERADEYVALLQGQWFQNRAYKVGGIAGILAMGSLLLPTIDMVAPDGLKPYLTLIIIGLAVSLSIFIWFHGTNAHDQD